MRIAEPTMESPRAARVCKVAGVAVALIFSVYLLAYVFGQGSRGDFSPDTLERRTQRELLLPMLEVPIYRSGYYYNRYGLVDFLVAEGYWTPNDVDEPRW